MFLCFQPKISVKTILKIKCYLLGPKSIGSSIFLLGFKDFEIYKLAVNKIMDSYTWNI